MPDQSFETLQEIVYITLHDLANPLTIMQNYIAFLAEAYEQQDEEMIELCVQGLKKSSMVVRDLFKIMHDLYFTE